MQAITLGATLVADDLVELAVRNHRLCASLPDAAKAYDGAIQLAGLGILRAPRVQKSVAIDLVVDLGVVPERMPASREVELMGVTAGWLALDAFAAGAAAKLTAALTWERIDA